MSLSVSNDVHEGAIGNFIFCAISRLRRMEPLAGETATAAPPARTALEPLAGDTPDVARFLARIEPTILELEGFFKQFGSVSSLHLKVDGPFPLRNQSYSGDVVFSSAEAVQKALEDKFSLQCMLHFIINSAHPVRRGMFAYEVEEFSGSRETGAILTFSG